MNRYSLLVEALLMVWIAIASLPADASAQLAVSANDGKVMLVDGVNTPRPQPRPDTVTIINLGVSPPAILAELHAPASVVGPPHSVAIMPDRSMALVTASTKIDPADPRATVPDDTVTVIDLKSSPPAAIATLRAGRSAAGIAINRLGTLALVANRGEGTVSVFTIAGKTVTPSGKVDLGAPDSMPSQVMFTADGRSALVTRNAASDNRISILAVEGTRVQYTKQDFFTGLQPYGMDLTPAGNLAVVAHVGTGPTGGTDTVSLIDLAASPPRAIDQIAVGPIPEGVAISPNGRYVAVTVMNGSNAAKSSPFFNNFSLLKILQIDGRRLSMVAEARTGHWCQGAAWNQSGNTVLVQCMVEEEIQLFSFDGKSLKASGALKMNGGPGGNTDSMVRGKRGNWGQTPISAEIGV